MPNWIAVADPPSQTASRAVAYSSGRIDPSMRVEIPARLQTAIGKADPAARATFDLLATRMSVVFPTWKGTRVDFRFADDEGTPVFVLTPMKRFVRVEIRTDATGYRDRKGVFPRAAPESYPGTWKRANVASIAEATEIAQDIEDDLRL